MSNIDYNKNRNLREKKKIREDKRIKLQNFKYLKVKNFIEAEKAMRAFIFCHIIFEMAPDLTIPKKCYVLGVWNKYFNNKSWYDVLRQTLGKKDFQKINSARDIINLDDIGKINDWKMIKNMCVCNI